MKADRRHELRENDLVHAIETVRTNLAQNAKPIGFAILGVVGVFVIASLAMRSRSVAKEDNWRRLSQLLFDKPETARESFEALTALTKNTGDQNFLLHALMEQARQALAMGQKPDALPDREAMDRATDAFNQLLQKFPDNPLAVGTAHCGLATVAENMFVITRQSKYKAEATRHLDAVVKTPILNGLPFQRIALDRLASLDNTFRLVELGPPTETASAAPLAPPVALPPSQQVNPAVARDLEALRQKLQQQFDANLIPTEAPSEPNADPADPEYGVDTPESEKDQPKPPSNP